MVFRLLKKKNKNRAKNSSIEGAVMFDTQCTILGEKISLENCNISIGKCYIFRCLLSSAELVLAKLLVPEMESVSELPGFHIFWRLRILVSNPTPTLIGIFQNACDLFHYFPYIVYYVPNTLYRRNFHSFFSTTGNYNYRKLKL